MHVFRWLPAIAVAACFAAPEAHAQAWLHWKPPAQQQDPAKRIASPRRPSLPVAAPILRQGPSVTISETPPDTSPAATTVAAESLSTASVTAVASTIAATPAIVVPPDAHFSDPPVTSPTLIADSMQATPSRIAANAMPTATPAIATACNDCPTQAELAATPGGSGPSDTRRRDREIQSEAKRRLLQGH